MDIKVIRWSGAKFRHDTVMTCLFIVRNDTPNAAVHVNQKIFTLKDMT